MRAHLLTVVALAASTAALPTTIASAATGGPPIAAHAPKAHLTSTFSPDGDGVRDEAVLRYTLARPATGVTVVISRRADAKRVRTVRLGAQDRGTQAWWWDGRDARGRRVRDATYDVALTAVRGAQREQLAGLATVVDTHFASGLRSSAPTAYPRSTAVRDAIVLSVSMDEAASSVLVIKDARGAVVLRRRAVDVSGTPEVEWDARDGAGRALRPGKYVATVRGRDRAGNRDEAGVVLRVSSQKLVWHTETRTVRPSDVNRGACSLSTSNSCGDQPSYCGDVVPSARFPGGVSHRSAFCDEPSPPDEARSYNWDTFAGAMTRGLHSARVSFTGAPTYDGEQDPGRLVLSGDDGISSVTSAVGGSTTWVSGLRNRDSHQYGGTIGRLPPLVGWSFATEGDDAFDVASYTVQARYLVVAE